MQETVQPAPKLNGQHAPPNDKRVITCYKKHGRKETLKRYGLTDSQLYTLLHRSGVRLLTASHRTHGKARRAAKLKTRGGSKGRKSAAPRASYKPLGTARAGGLADALVYLGQARERAGSAGLYAIAGLVSLAIEALGGE